MFSNASVDLFHSQPKPVRVLRDAVVKYVLDGDEVHAGSLLLQEPQLVTAIGARVLCMAE